MTYKLLKALSEAELLGGAHIKLFQRLGVDISVVAPSANPVSHPKVDGFYGAVSRLGHIDINTIMMLAEEYLSDVVTPHYHKGELSAYDVLRHKMLIGGCDKFLVIYGSLSGIQSYLFDVKSSHALKQLRGRSFYLHLLQDAVVERIIREFGVTRQTVMYSTGGTFCMLLPYVDGIEEQFACFKREICQSVFKAHGQNMVLLNSQVATTKDLTEDLANVFSALHRQKNRDKHSPLSDNMQELYGDFFTPQAISTFGERDDAEELGSVLGRMKYTLISSKEVDVDALAIVEPGNLGIKYHLLSSCKIQCKGEADAYDSLIIYNDIELPDVAIGCRREYIAGIGALTQSFADLFGNVPDVGIKRLGVLRMDVDNLGQALRSCYERENAMAHYARMSRRLDIFFKKTLNNLWHENFKSSSVIVYSGGDDLFIVGEWSQVVDFASEINLQYKAFFADKGITISGGISLVAESFPIIRAAEYSADEENLAKCLAYTDSTGKRYEKNAFSMFGMPLRWDVEWPIIWEIYKELSHLVIAHEQVYRPILRRILRYFEIVRFENRQITPLRQIWLMTYDLDRAIKRMSGVTRYDKDFLMQCKDDIIKGVTMRGKRLDTPYHSLQLWAIAARLVELITRKNTK